MPRVAVLVHFNLAPVGLGGEHFEYARLETGSHAFSVYTMRKVESFLIPSLRHRVSHHQPPLAHFDLELLRIGIREGNFYPIGFFIFDDQRLAKITYASGPPPAFD